MPWTATITIILCFSVIVHGDHGDSILGNRAYDVLKKQDMVTLGSVLAVLLLLMVFMAICIYKPLPRR